MQPDAPALLWDVKNVGARIAEFISGLDAHSYAEDELRKSAVERQLEIIGEALNSLRKRDPDTAAGISELHRIVGLRNILIHGYSVIDDSVVWVAARERVPELVEQVTALLSRS